MKESDKSTQLSPDELKQQIKMLQTQLEAYEKEYQSKAQARAEEAQQKKALVREIHTYAQAYSDGQLLGELNSHNSALKKLFNELNLFPREKIDKTLTLKELQEIRDHWSHLNATLKNVLIEYDQLWEKHNHEPFETKLLKLLADICQSERKLLRSNCFKYGDNFFLYARTYFFLHYVCRYANIGDKDTLNFLTDFNTKSKNERDFIPPLVEACLNTECYNHFLHTLLTSLDNHGLWHVMIRKSVPLQIGEPVIQTSCLSLLFRDLSDPASIIPIAQNPSLGKYVVSDKEKHQKTVLQILQHLHTKKPSANHQNLAEYREQVIDQDNNIYNVSILELAYLANFQNVIIWLLENLPHEHIVDVNQTNIFGMPLLLLSSNKEMALTLLKVLPKEARNPSYNPQPSVASHLIYPEKCASRIYYEADEMEVKESFADYLKRTRKFKQYVEQGGLYPTFVPGTTQQTTQCQSPIGSIVTIPSTKISGLMNRLFGNKKTSNSTTLSHKPFTPNSNR